MTPQEKARELVDRYSYHEFFNTPLDVDGMLEFMPESIAKQCALIAINFSKELISHKTLKGINHPVYIELLQIEQEINKL